jgi:hypothetical protein
MIVRSNNVTERDPGNLTAAGNVITDAPGVDVDVDGDSLVIVGLAAGDQPGELEVMSARRSWAPLAA